jgi:hypothetical protein
MDTFHHHLFNLRDQALEAAGHARHDLTLVLAECEDHRFAEAMERLAYAQPYARWWMRVTDEIEHGGLNPMTALTQVRTAARQALLNSYAARPRSWFTIALDNGATEATRRFYHDTARFNLDTITGTGPAAPTVTRIPGMTGPSTGATPHRQATSPLRRSAINPGTADRPHTGPTPARPPTGGEHDDPPHPFADGPQGTEMFPGADGPAIQ